MAEKKSKESSTIFVLKAVEPRKSEVSVFKSLYFRKILIYCFVG